MTAPSSGAQVRAPLLIYSSSPPPEPFDKDARSR